MGLAAPKTDLLTPADYFALVASADEKFEFAAGRAFSMAGGSAVHSLICANVIRSAGNQLLDKPCPVYDSNLRVCVRPGTFYCYPDASVICGPIEFDSTDKSGQTAVNPRLIVEVLSPSTEGYDRGDKFRRYLQIASFQEYVLVSQTVPVVETYTRQPDGAWGFRAYEGLKATAPIQSLDIKLRLADVFAGVEFPAPVIKDGAF